MIIEFLYRIIELDIPWLVNFASSNLIWIFIFIATIFIFFEGKHVLLATVILIIDVWAWISFTSLLDWVLLTGGLLAIYYISKIAILGFAANEKSLQKHLPLITVLHGAAVIILYNMFMVGA